MLAAMTFGNCGYSFPAAMGAKIAAPDRNCVAYVGDGAWGMQLNEVLTCVREEVPTTAVVFNNGQWGAEKKNQVLWFGDRYVVIFRGRMVELETHVTVKCYYTKPFLILQIHRISAG